MTDVDLMRDTMRAERLERSLALQALARPLTSARHRRLVQSLRPVARRADDYRGKPGPDDAVAYVLVTGSGRDVGGPYADLGFARSLRREFAPMFDGLDVEAVRLS